MGSQVGERGGQGVRQARAHGTGRLGRAVLGLVLALGGLLGESGVSGAQTLAPESGAVWAQTLAPEGGAVWAQTLAPESSAVWAQAAAPASGAASAPAAPAGPGAAGAPRFPQFGPSQPALEAEGPARAGSALPAGRTQRCRWDLAGVWEGRGQQSDPTGNSYSTRLVVQQYGNYLTAAQPADGIAYYGVCSGDRVEMDAYSGDTYIGVQTGTVSGNGRRIESTWVLYRPDYAAGYETLTAAGRQAR